MASVFGTESDRQYFARDRVDSLLTGASNDHSVIILSGSTGCGKTVAISSFVAKTKEHVIWIQLGATDTGSELFWQKLVRELKGWDEVLAEYLSGARFPDTPVAINLFLDQINQAADRTGKAIFVFDDFHKVLDDPACDLIVEMVNSCSGHISIILISGKKVHINVHAGIKIASFESEHLHFTRDEIRVYYTALGIVLTVKLLEEIWKVTQGWAAAVYLLARHLPRAEILSEVCLDGAIGNVFRQFDEEYFKPLAEKSKQALILLSLLDEFTIELFCDLLPLKKADREHILVDNAFIACRHDSDILYFHSLLRNYLHLKQASIHKSIRQRFLRKAAKWYEEKGAIWEPVAYYVRGGDYAALQNVLYRILVTYAKHDLTLPLVELLAEVPEEAIREKYRLQLYYYLALYRSGQKKQTLYMLTHLQNKLELKNRTPDEDAVLGEIYAIQAFEMWNRSSPEYLNLLKRASELLPGAADVSATGLFGNVLRFMDMLPGDLLIMAESSMQAIPMIRKVAPSLSGAGYLAVSEAHMYRLEFKKAMHYASQAISDASEWQRWDISGESNYILLRISMARGNLQEILYYIEQTRLYSEKWGDKSHYSVANISQLHFCVYLGLYHLIDDPIRQDPLQSVQRVNMGREMYVWAYYMVFGAKQSYAAITYIDNAIPVCRENGFWFPRLKMVIIKAIVYGTLGQVELATHFLEEAYQMAHGNEILFPFTELGEHILALLEQVQKYCTRIEPSWFERVRQEAVRYEERRQQAILEYLRENPQHRPRKLEKLERWEYIALRHLCQGMTTKEVSEKLNICDATVHRYMSSVYQKIGARDRTDAIRIAVIEGILD